MLNWLYFEIYFQIKNSGSATVWPRYDISVPDFNLMSVTADLRDGGLTIWPYQKNPLLRKVNLKVLLVTERLYASRVCHSLLWSKPTTPEKSQRDYMHPESVTVCCGQSP